MATRSRTGCLTCRQRKLKCSEERPVCAQCIKARRDCIPSSGITFRHQQNPSLNGESREPDSLKNFYGYKETFNRGTVWVEVPRELTFVHTNNPYEEPEYDVESGPLPSEGNSLFDDANGQDLSLAAGLDVGSDDDDRIDAALASGLAALAENASRYGETGQTAFGEVYATHGLEALSTVAINQDQHPATNNAGVQDEGDMQHQAQSGQLSSHNDLDYILNPASSRNNNIDPRLHAETSSKGDRSQSPRPQQSPSLVRNASSSHSAQRPSSQIEGHVHRGVVVTDPELVFLLRNFSDHAGKWMDLLGPDMFFASEVPFIASRSPILLYACTALSAKLLARRADELQTFAPTKMLGKDTGKEGQSDIAKGIKSNVHIARDYYELAVSLLRQVLAQSTSELDERNDSTTLSTTKLKLSSTEREDFFIATIILCTYEFMDFSFSGPEWDRQLDGAKSVFDIVNEQIDSMTLSNPQALSANQKVGFWHFARLDMFSAFIKNTFTSLDTSNFSMWRLAGLELSTHGMLVHLQPDLPLQGHTANLSDDQICNSLIWLLMKLVNFIAAGDDVPIVMAPLGGFGVKQEELLDYWQTIAKELQAWYDRLPDSFQPTAICSVEQNAGVPLIQEWFSRPMCASIMQTYHFACIQLLHNKPHLSTGPALGATPTSGSRDTLLAARHASYSTILKQSRMHAERIVAISLACSDEASRIHGIQPLWTAGLVLGGSADADVDDRSLAYRHTIIRHLRDVQRDTGWASDYRVKSLLDLWSLPGSWPDDNNET